MKKYITPAFLPFFEREMEIKMEILVIDCLTAGEGERIFTRDFIGSGPRYVAGFIEEISNGQFTTALTRGELVLQDPAFWLKNHPILCVSAMTMDKGIVKKILSLWEGFFPHKLKRLAIMGGPFTSERNILQQIRGDIAVIGEAEWALHSLFKKHASTLASLFGLGNGHTNSKSGQGKNWKALLFPHIPHVCYSIDNRVAFSDLPIDRTNPWFIKTSGYPVKIKAYENFEFSRIYVECLRGCSNYRRTSLDVVGSGSCSNHPCNICRDPDFKTRETCPQAIPPGCGFCSTIHEFGSPKSRAVAPILEEINALIQSGVRRIVLGGPGFLDFHRESLTTGALIDPNHPMPNYSQLDELISNICAIPEIKNLEAQVFIENIKASLCTDQALDLIAQLPNPIFSIGCETGSAKFANMLGRPGLPEQTYDAVKRAIARGIRVHVYFIHSLPGDTAVFGLETLDLIKKFGALGVDKITLYKYQELPGSPFWGISSRYTHFDKATVKTTIKIKKAIIAYNNFCKTRLLGKEIRVFLTEPNNQFPKDGIGWMLEGGPKVSVSNASGLIGSFQNVIVDRVLSDKLVLAHIVKPKN